MNKSRIKRAAVYASIAFLVGGGLLTAGGLAALKAKSLYDRLASKMDYITEVVYRMETDLSDVRYTVSRGFAHYDFDYAWAQEPDLVAHAMGGIDGKNYTNSVEAFEENYARGYRVFEVDFGLTEQSEQMLCLHDEQLWREQTGIDESIPCDHASFMASKLYGQYTPMDCSGLIDLMIAYPDIYIVTDTKHSVKHDVMYQFSQLVRCAVNKDASVLDRIIPQIYHEEMLGWVMAVHPFKSMIYTLYATEWTQDSVQAFCERSGVGMVTMWSALAKPEIVEAWNRAGIQVAVHTVNDAQRAKEHLEQGVQLVYSDDLLPADF